MNINFDPASRQPKGILAQVVTVIVGLIALVAMAMFSLIFFAAVAVAGLIFWLYFWWKTRALRKQIREQMQAQPFETQQSRPSSAGDVIDGEAVRVVDERNRLSE